MNHFFILFFSFLCLASCAEPPTALESPISPSAFRAENQDGITNVGNGKTNSISILPGRIEKKERISNVGNGKVLPVVKKPSVAVGSLDLKTAILNSQLHQDKEFISYEKGQIALPEPFTAPLPKGLVVKADRIRRGNFEKSNGQSDGVRPISLVTIPTMWSIHCNANWTEECEGTEVFVPPFELLKNLRISVMTSDGKSLETTSSTSWEICKFEAIVETKSDNASWAIKKADTNSITFWVKSRGSHIPYDQWGSDVRVRLANVVYLIGSSASTEDERGHAQCNYNGSGSSASAAQEQLFCAADPFDPGSTIGVQMCGDYIWQDGGRKMIRGPYACGVCARN